MEPNVDFGRHFFAPALQLQLPHPGEILCDLEQPLLALLLDETRPIHELLLDLLDRLFEISRQLHLFPHSAGEGGALDGFHVEEANSFLLSNGGVLYCAVVQFNVRMMKVTLKRHLAGYEMKFELKHMSLPGCWRGGTMSDCKAP